MGDIKYTELSKAKVQESRSLVISSTSKGGFTIAQMLEVEEGQRKTNVFLKGAVIVSDISGLYNLRDAVNVAIDKYEKSARKSNEHYVEWD